MVAIIEVLSSKSSVFIVRSSDKFLTVRLSEMNKSDDHVDQLNPDER
jgi:hypothetical protein